MNKGIVPFLEFAREHQVQFQMHVRALAIDSHSRVTHDRDVLFAMHCVAHADVDLTKMAV